MAGWFRGCGLAGIVSAALLAAGGGSATLSWYIGAGIGGAVYLAAPSDATWWLAPLTTLPAVAPAMYFSEPTGRRGDSNQGPWTPPSGG